jgi:hypothetical protein
MTVLRAKSPILPCTRRGGCAFFLAYERELVCKPVFRKGLQAVATLQILIAGTHAATLLTRVIHVFVNGVGDDPSGGGSGTGNATDLNATPFDATAYLIDQTRALQTLATNLYIANVCRFPQKHKKVI